MIETFIVQETKPVYRTEKPMAFIVIDGRISSIPCRWKLKAGDVITIKRTLHNN